MVPTHAHPGTASRKDDVSRATRLFMKCFPVQDGAFARAAGHVLDELATIGGPEPRALEARLRAAYPRVRIVPRQVLSSAGVVAEELWYAFRDGAAQRAPLEFE
jgi:hypothetical protein